MNAEELQQQFGIGKSLRFERGDGGLLRAVIATEQADATVYLQGAHVAEWTPRGQRPVLFISDKSFYTPGKAIRGGVPIIFPWFGARGGGLPGPAHGFARSLEWALTGAEKQPDGAIAVHFSLAPNEATRSYGYADVLLEFHVTVGTSLMMELVTRNEGNAPLTFENALHTYISIGDIDQASIAGLEGTTYIDKTDGFKEKQVGSAPLHIAKETDQVHLNTSATCTVEDKAWGRRVLVEKSGSHSTVVWNPWAQKTAGFADMGPEEWRGMVCVESANAASDAITLAAGATHRLRALLRVA